MTKFLVIGDTIIDEEVYAVATGLSLESPTRLFSIKALFDQGI